MEEDTEYKSAKGSKDVKFNKNGDIFFKTTDKKATNAIKFKTLGFYAALQQISPTTEVDSLSPSWYFKRGEFVPLQISDIGIPYRKAVY